MSASAPRLLTVADDYLHPVGPEKTWNESRYSDCYDATEPLHPCHLPRRLVAVR